MLTTIMTVIGFATGSVVARFVLFAYFFAKPLNDINKHLAKEFKSAARAMDDARQPDFSTRNQYKNDADWAAATFTGRYHPISKSDDADESSGAQQKTEMPPVPASSWILFADSDADGNPIMHARLALTAQDGNPVLTVELRQPKHAIGDAGGTADIAFASVNQASCGDADSLVLRFDNQPAMRYAAKGVWEDDSCRFGLPDFGKFRDGLINATNFAVRIGKANALTQEIAAPVGGLNWNP